jgi:hypothetical protein
VPLIPLVPRHAGEVTGETGPGHNRGKADAAVLQQIAQAIAEEYSPPQILAFLDEAGIPLVRWLLLPAIDGPTTRSPGAGLRSGSGCGDCDSPDR